MDEKAELILNGPKGFATATVEVPVTDYGLEAALVQVKQLYDDLPEPASHA